MFRPGGYQLSIFMNYVIVLKPSQTLKSDQFNSSINVYVFQGRGLLSLISKGNINLIENSRGNGIIV